MERVQIIHAFQVAAVVILGFASTWLRLGDPISLAELPDSTKRVLALKPVPGSSSLPMLPMQTRLTLSLISGLVGAIAALVVFKYTLWGS